MKWRTLELKAYILFKCRRKFYYVILCKTSYPWAWRTLIALTGLSKLIWPCNVNIDDSKIFCQPILLDVILCCPAQTVPILICEIFMSLKINICVALSYSFFLGYSIPDMFCLTFFLILIYFLHNVNKNLKLFNGSNSIHK